MPRQFKETSRIIQSAAGRGSGRSHPYQHPPDGGDRDQVFTRLDSSCLVNPGSIDAA